MARKILNIGVIANDGKGDRLRDAFSATQDNTAELYNFLGGDELTSLKARQKLNVPSVEDVALSLTPKADLTYVNTAIGAISTDAGKQYATLALATSDIANLPLNKNVFISEAANGGYWYKELANSTTLKKSAFDPVVISEKFTKNEVSKLKIESAEELHKVAQTIIGSNILSDSIVSMGLKKTAKISAGSFSHTTLKESILKIDMVTVANNIAEKQKITAMIDGQPHDIFTDLRSREVVEDAVLSTYFSDPILLDSLQVNEVSAYNAEQTRIWFKSEMTPNSNFSSTNSINVYCADIPSYTLGSVGSQNVVILGHSGGFIGVYVLNSYVTGLGYALNKASLTQFIKDIYPDTYVEYYTNSLKKKPCALSAKIPAAKTVAISALNGTAKASVYTEKDTPGTTATPNLIEIATLNETDSIVAAGTKTLAKDSVISLETVTTSDNTANAKTLTVTQSGKTLFNLSLKAFERVEKNNRISAYKNITVASMIDGVSGVTETTDHVLINFSSTLTPDAMGTLNGFSCYSQKLKSTSVSAGATAIGDNFCALHNSGFIRLYIAKTKFTGAASIATAKQYIEANLYDEVLSYRTVNEEKYPLASVFEIKAGDIVTNSAGITFAISVLSKTDSVIEASYTEFKCDIDNNTNYNFTNYLIEMKVDFERGLVSSNDQLFIEDQNGIQIPAQFEQARNNNVRKSGRIGQYVDGSFKTGSIWISDSIDANVKKDYVLKLKKQTLSAVPKLTKTTSGYSIAVNGYTYNFDSAQAFLLSSVRVLTATKAYLSSATCREVNAGNTAFNTLNFTLDPEIKLISSGPVFSEIEVVVYNQAGEKLAAKALKLTLTYLLFSSGKMRIKSLLSATQDISANVLGGYTLAHQLNISGGVRSSAYGSALITATEASLASPISVVMTVANGDLHRDGQDYGPSRPTTAVFSATTGSVRTSFGWDTSSIGNTTLTRYGVPKNWTWTTEMWVNFAETQTTAEKCSQACVNRPVGFLGKTINKFFAREFIIQKMIQNARGYYAAVTAPETAAVGGINRDQKTNYNYPNLFDLTETLLLGKDIDTAWANFYAYMNRNYKPSNQSEIDLKQFYLDGRMSSQYIWYRVLCPIQYFYQFAKKLGKTSIVETCEMWIEQYSEAVVQTVNDIGWFPLTPSILSPAANANSTGIWALGLAINMGLDGLGFYETTFNTLVGLVANPSANGRWLPIAMDTMDDAEPIAKQRWMRYEGVINYMFNEGHALAGKTSAVDMTNNFIRFSNGDGNLQLIDASRSESRRGAFQEPIEILHACVRKGTKSSLNLAYAIAKNYELYAPYDLLKSNRMYDVDAVNSSWNDTVKQVDTFSFLFCKLVLDKLVDAI